MEITLYGVRGSTPVPGPSTNEFGGNTSCVLLTTSDGRHLVFDAGTGICNLAKKMMTTPLGKGQGSISIFLSHTHWDHIQGIPFFVPIFIPGNRISIYGCGRPGVSLADALEGQVATVYSPICSMSNFPATVEIHELTGDTVEGAPVKWSSMPHGGIHTQVYRVEEGAKSFVYMTDVEYPNGIPDEAIAFARDASVLIHDTHFRKSDYQPGSGHSSVETAVELARRANVRKLVLYHYHPDYDDADLAILYEECKNQEGLVVIAGQEGLKLLI